MIDIILNINAVIILILWLSNVGKDEDSIPVGVLIYLYLGTIITAGLIICNLFLSCRSIIENP